MNIDKYIKSLLVEFAAHCESDEELTNDELLMTMIDWIKGDLFEVEQNELQVDFSAVSFQYNQEFVVCNIPFNKTEIFQIKLT
jgi:hypothetical protein